MCLKTVTSMTRSTGIDKVVALLMPAPDSAKLDSMMNMSEKALSNFKTSCFFSALLHNCTHVHLRHFSFIIAHNNHKQY